jgi:hypothetical protein
MRWKVKDYDGFAARYCEARLAYTASLADDLLDESKEAKGKDMAGVQAQRLITDTAKWILGRTNPDYTDKLQLGGQLGGNARIVIVSLPEKGGDGRMIDGQTVPVLPHEQMLPGPDAADAELIEDGTQG